MAAIKGAPSPNPNGRKPGKNRRTLARLALAQKSLAGGVQPLEVLITNMRFYHNRAEKILQRVEIALSRMVPVDADGEVVDAAENGDDAKSPAELLDMLKELYGYKELAEKCAVDAAPYVHPRLAAVAVRYSEDLKQQMTPEEISEEARKRGLPDKVFVQDAEVIDVVPNPEPADLDSR